MNRVVLDTAVIVSALLVPRGTQAQFCYSPWGDVALRVSPAVLAEYEEVLRRRGSSCRRGRSRRHSPPSVRRRCWTHALTVAAHEPDNRFLECAETAIADYLVTGNIRHFPGTCRTTRIVTGRQFLDLLTVSDKG